MGFIKNALAKLIARRAAKVLALQEGTPMENKKPWYRSKTIWGGVYVVLRTAYTALQGVLAPQMGWALPNVPPILDTIVGTIVGEEIIRGRFVADKKIA